MKQLPVNTHESLLPRDNSYIINHIGILLLLWI